MLRSPFVLRKTKKKHFFTVNTTLLISMLVLLIRQHVSIFCTIPTSDDTGWSADDRDWLKNVALNVLS